MEWFGRPKRGTVHRQVWRVKNRSKIKDGRKGKASAKKKGEKVYTLERYTGVGGSYWNETYLHRPVDYAKKLKLRFRVAYQKEEIDITVVRRRT